MAHTLTRQRAAIPVDAPLWRTVLWLALPAVGEQVLNTLVGLADTYMIGHLDATLAVQLGYDRPTALAAAGIANLLAWIGTVLFMAVAMGATAVVARRIGAGEEERADLAVRQALLLGIVAGFVATLMGLFLAEPALRLLGAEPEVVVLGAHYLSISSLAFLPAALMFASTAALRGAGDTRSPLYLMLLVNGVNIALNWLLINGHLGAPALGITGSAIGTVAARVVGAVVILALLFAGRMQLRPRFDFRPHWQTLHSIVKVGLPAAGEQFVFQGAILITTSLITGLGTVAYAAHNLTVTIESVSFLPGIGFGVAATTLVGQALGARDPERAERSAWIALWQGGTLMTVLGIVMVAAPEMLFRLMTPETAIAEAGVMALRLAGLGQVFLATSFILNGALRGAGDTRWPLLMRVVATWLVRLPVAFLLVSAWGLTGIWTAMLLDFVAQALLTIWRFNGGYWKTIEV